MEMFQTLVTTNMAADGLTSCRKYQVFVSTNTAGNILWCNTCKCRNEMPLTLCFFKFNFQSLSCHNTVLMLWKGLKLPLWSLQTELDTPLISDHQVHRRVQGSGSGVRVRLVPSLKKFSQGVPEISCSQEGEKTDRRTDRRTTVRGHKENFSLELYILSIQQRI